MAKSEIVVESKLQQLEATITKGLRSFVDVGKALQEIRDSKVYVTPGCPTFEQYCQDRWEMSKTQANRLIQAAQVVEAIGMTPIGVTSESQARELVPLLDRPELLRKTWAEVVGSGEKITAALIKDAVARVLAPPEGEEEEDSEEEDESEDFSTTEEEEEEDEDETEDSSESEDEDTCIRPTLTLHEFERGILSSHEFWPWFIRGYSPDVVQDLLSKDDRMGEDRLTKKETLELVRGLANQLSAYAEMLEKSL